MVSYHKSLADILRPVALEQKALYPHGGEAASGFEQPALDLMSPLFHSTLMALPHAGSNPQFPVVIFDHRRVGPAQTSGASSNEDRTTTLTDLSRDVEKFGKLPKACTSSSPHQNWRIAF